MGRDVKETVYESLREIAKDQGLNFTEIAEEHRITEDLGFASLEIATLVSLLEIKLNISPFTDNAALITEIQTVADLCNVYQRYLSQEHREATNSEDKDTSESSTCSRGEARRQAAERRKAKKSAN